MKDMEDKRILLENIKFSKYIASYIRIIYINKGGVRDE